MAELRDILASGDITNLQLGDVTVYDLLVILREWRANYIEHGIGVPELGSIDANNNSVFVNTDGTVDKLCFKNADGDVLEFRMRPV